jgi:hypothetical protein
MQTCGAVTLTQESGMHLRVAESLGANGGMPIAGSRPDRCAKELVYGYFGSDSNRSDAIVSDVSMSGCLRLPKLVCG